MKASERHRTRRENAFKLLTNHKAKRSKTNFSPVFHKPASKKKNESMICKKSVEDVVRTKSLTSFCEPREQSQRRRRQQQSSFFLLSKLLDKNKKRFERKKIPIPRDFETTASHPAWKKAQEPRFRSPFVLLVHLFCFFPYRWVMSFGGSRFRHRDDYGGCCERREEERVLRHHHRSFVAKEREREREKRVPKRR